jgi:cell division protease FtsH
MFVGVGAARVRDLFEQAKRNAPCIIFVDEIDAVGRHRGAGVGGGHDEREQTLNQILTEMDGFRHKRQSDRGRRDKPTRHPRPGAAQAGSLRPAHHHRAPDVKERHAILKVHQRTTSCRRCQPGDDRTPDAHDERADLANLTNEAALLAARRGLKEIGAREMEDAADRVMMGPERKSRVMSEKEKLITAYHESGHALVAKMLPHADPVHKVSIISRGMAGGYPMSLPTEDRPLTCLAPYLNDRITIALGGRAAEELKCDDITNRRSERFEGSHIHREAHGHGVRLSDRLGPRTFGQKQEMVFLGREISEQKDYSDDTAREIDDEIRIRIDRAHAVARKLLETNADKLEKLARLLIEKETIAEEDIASVFDSRESQPAAA